MTIEQIRPAELLARVAEPRAKPYPATLLDVREPWEVATASVQASEYFNAQTLTVLNIPMQQVPSQLATLDAEQDIFVLCHHGMRSLQVAQYLQHQGFGHVYNVDGGIHAWSQEVDPSVPAY